MPIDIGKFPRGIMSQLALRSQGLGPQSLSELVAPVVNLSDQYLLDTRESIQASSFVGAVALSANYWPAPNDLIVPAGELWYVWHYFASVSPTAAQALQFVVSAEVEGLPASCPLGDPVNVPLSAHGRTYMRKPGWFGPGTRFNFVVYSFTGAPTVTGAMVLTRLRV